MTADAKRNKIHQTLHCFLKYISHNAARLFSDQSRSYPDYKLLHILPSRAKPISPINRQRSAGNSLQIQQSGLKWTCRPKGVVAKLQNCLALAPRTFVVSIDYRACKINLAGFFMDKTGLLYQTTDFSPWIREMTCAAVVFSRNRIGPC